MPSRKKHPTDGMPVFQVLCLAARRLHAQVRNGNLTDVRVGLAFLGPYAPSVLIEMLADMDAVERSALARALLDGLTSAQHLRPAARHELARLARLQLDAEQE